MQHLSKLNKFQKGRDIDCLVYRLQFIKAYQFIKLNEEGYNDDFH